MPLRTVIPINAPTTPLAMAAAFEDAFAKAPPFEPRSINGRKVHLLIVEDDHFIRQTVTLMLNDPRLILHFAVNGVEAVHKYIELQPHMLFLDIELPDASGLDILKLVHRYDPYNHVIMLTGHAEAGNVLMAKHNGARGYVAKPFNGQRLMECVHRYLGVNNGPTRSGG